MKEICEDFGKPSLLTPMCLSCRMYRNTYCNMCIAKHLSNKNMKTKEIKINVPEGYEIDKENSTFECIKFKPIVKKWRDDKEAKVSGYYIDNKAETHQITYGLNNEVNRNIFATEKQAKSALAMAQISQIMANDERFGSVVTEDEWNKSNWKTYIYCIDRFNNKIAKCENYVYNIRYRFLAFHTKEQRDLFLAENEDLVKQYLMID